MTFKIGFHAGPAGNHNGIGNYYKQLDDAGRPFVIKSVDHYGHIYEAAQYTNADHVLVFRLSTRGQGDGYDYDVPDYDKTPQAAAIEHMGRTIAKLPPEFDKSRVWLEVINEVDKERSDWLGEFAYECGLIALEQGYKVLQFGWSSGEPEPEHWSTIGMLGYLELCQMYPNDLGIALHEYSYDRYDINRLEGDLIGRFLQLFEVCDSYGIKRPKTVITEWGWEHTKIPDSVGEALIDIADIARLYEQYPEILGAAIWYLGSGYSNIHNQTQRLIQPVTETALSWVSEAPNSPTVPTPPQPEPQPGNGVDLLFPAWVGTFLLHPAKLNQNQRSTINGWLANGISANLMRPDARGRSVGFAGWTHQDALQMTHQLAVVNKMRDTRLIVVDGEQIGDRLDQLWIAENFPELLPFVRFVSTGDANPKPEPDPPPDSFSPEYWPLQSNDRTVTQRFGANPALYAPFGFPGHEGIDYRAPIGTPVIAIADGEILHSSQYRFSSGALSAYGYHMVIDHGSGYRSLYAHLSPSGLLPKGRRVKAGDMLGVIGYRETSAENTTGPHLHLSLLDTNLADNGWPYTTYGRYYDPTPVMLPSLPTKAAEPKPEPPSGYHGPSVEFVAGVDQPASDWYWPYAKVVFEDTALYPKWHAKGNNVEWWDMFKHPSFNLVRVIIDPSWSNPDVTAIFNEVRGDIQRFYDRGARDFVLFNEPNVENLGVLVQNGYEFGNIYTGVAALVRDRFPGVRIWHTPMSPGGDGRMTGQQFQDQMFTRGSVATSDGIVMHAYTGTTNDQAKAVKEIVNQVKWWQSMYSLSRPLVIGEFSVNRPATAEYKAAVYKEVYRQLKAVPGVQGAYSFTASWYGGQNRDEWGRTWDVHQEGWFESGVYTYFTGRLS